MRARPGIAPHRGAAQILRDRARALARVEALPPDVVPIEVLGFELGRERYAVETRYVREVCVLRNLAPLPCTPPFVLGIFSARGRILPVIDIRTLFDLPGHGLGNLNRVVVVADGEMELGLVADAIGGVRAVSASALQPALQTLAVRAEYFKGVTADRLAVLDLGRMLADPAIVVHEDVEE